MAEAVSAHIIQLRVVGPLIAQEFFPEHLRESTTNDSNVPLSWIGGNTWARWPNAISR